MTPELAGLALALISAIVAGAVAWGRISKATQQLESDLRELKKDSASEDQLAEVMKALRQMIAELATRHAENSTEFRSAIAHGASRLNTIERVQGATDIHLDAIRSQLADIKALLSPTPRRKP